MSTLSIDLHSSKSTIRLPFHLWEAGLRTSSKHVGVTPGTELWTIDVVKWFISDVLKVKWQSYRAFFVNCLLNKVAPPQNDLIYTQRKKLSTPMFFWNDKWYDKYHEITDQIISRTQWWPVRTLHWPSWSQSYGWWICNYLCNQCLSPLTLWIRIPLKRGLLDTTLCDKVCQWPAAGR
jgi:hypothetical protein